MTFQIEALNEDSFTPLFDLDDAELEALGARREIARNSPGYPCRVSLKDAEIGETVLLTNFTHLPEASPFQASHAIYVRKNAVRANPAPGAVPEVLASRLLSVRGYSDDHMLIEADVVAGAALAPMLDTFFQNDGIAYIHIHNAKQGCFAARVTRG